MSTTNDLEKDNQITPSNNNEQNDINEITPSNDNEQNDINEITPSNNNEQNDSNIQNFTDTVFTSNNLLILVGFLGAYGIVYYLTKKNNPDTPDIMNNTSSNATSIVIDMFFLIVIGMILYTLYSSANANPE